MTSKTRKTTHLVLAGLLLASTTACGKSNMPSTYGYYGAQNQYGQTSPYNHFGVQQPMAYGQQGAYQQGVYQQPGMQQAGMQQPGMAGQAQQAMNTPAQQMAAPTQQVSAARSTRSSRSTRTTRSSSKRTSSKSIAAAPTTSKARVSKSAATKSPVRRASSGTRKSKASTSDAYLAKAAQAFNKLQTVEAMVESFETNKEKGPISGTLKYQYKAPSMGRLEFVKHTNSLYLGARLVYGHDGDKVQAQAGGMMSWMKITSNFADKKLTSRRDYRLDQVDLAAMVKRLTKPGQGAKLKGKMNLHGNPVLVFEFNYNGNHFDPTITKELLGIDQNNHMIRMHEMFVGDELVYSVKVSQMIKNKPLGPEVFTL